MRNIDIEFLRSRICAIFDVLYTNIPVSRNDDQLDGEITQFIAGKSYIELRAIIGDLLSDYSLFTLLEDNVSRYYLASFLLYFLDVVQESLEFFPKTNVPAYLGIAYVTTINFLSRQSTVDWMRGLPPLAEVTIDTLDWIANCAGLGFSLEDSNELMNIRNRISIESVKI